MKQAGVNKWSFYRCSRLWKHRRGPGRRAALAYGLVTCLAISVLAGCSSSTKSSSGTGSSATNSSNTSGGSGTAHGTPIVIGNIGSYTSAAGSAIVQEQQGLEAWVSSVNANGGIGGHPIKLILKQDNNTPATALAEAQELLRDHVVALVSNASFAAQTWGQLFQKAGVPIVGGGSSAFIPNDPLDFPSGTSTVSLAYGLFYGLKQEGATKIAIPYCAEIAACSQAVAFGKLSAASNGMQVVWGGSVSSSSPDLTPQCLAARSSGADGVEVALTEQETIHFAQACSQQGWNPVYSLTSTAVDNQILNVSALKTVISAQQVAPWFETTPALQEYQAAMAKYEPGTTISGPAALQGWVSGKLFQAAVQASGPSTVTPESVINGLYSLHQETLGGLAPPLTYTKGQPASIKCFFLVGVQDGKYTAPLGLRPACQP
jgi:branched-chain amino acid transport system substrate-binding protein